MRGPDCIFCRIVRRTVDALIIHEDAHTISFLPLEPAVVGHTLLVPKEHHDDIFSIPSDLLSQLMSSAQAHARHWRHHVGTSGVNVLHASGIAAEQSVFHFHFHFHFHLFPRFAGDGLRTWPALPRPAGTREEMHATFRLGPEHESLD